MWNRREKVLDTCNHPRQWRSSSDPAKASLPKAQGMMRVCVGVCASTSACSVCFDHERGVAEYVFKSLGNFTHTQFLHKASQALF